MKSSARAVTFTRSWIELRLTGSSAKTGCRMPVFGLAQLRQLRGRVGRTATRSFAYFLTDEGNVPTAISRRRLNVSAELARLGAGFEISEFDLDLRGTCCSVRFGTARASTFMPASGDRKLKQM